MSGAEKASSLLLDGGTAALLLAIVYWVVRYF